MFLAPGNDDFFTGFIGFIGFGERGEEGRRGGGEEAENVRDFL